MVKDVPAFPFYSLSKLRPFSLINLIHAKIHVCKMSMFKVSVICS